MCRKNLPTTTQKLRNKRISPKICRRIRRSELSNKSFAKKYGFHRNAVSKYRNQTLRFDNKPMGTKTPPKRSLSEQERSLVVNLHIHAKLSLDDCVVVIEKLGIKKVSRSTINRIFKKYGLKRLKTRTKSIPARGTKEHKAYINIRIGLFLDIYKYHHDGKDHISHLNLIWKKAPHAFLFDPLFRKRAKISGEFSWLVNPQEAPFDKVNPAVIDALISIAQTLASENNKVILPFNRSIDNSHEDLQEVANVYFTLEGNNQKLLSAGRPENYLDKIAQSEISSAWEQLGGRKAYSRRGGYATFYKSIVIVMQSQYIIRIVPDLEYTKLKKSTSIEDFTQNLMSIVKKHPKLSEALPRNEKWKDETLYGKKQKD